jgi:hypothetical protein
MSLKSIAALAKDTQTKMLMATSKHGAMLL